MGAIGERNVFVTQSVIERPPPPEESSYQQRRARCRSVLIEGSGEQLTPAIAKQALKAAKEGVALARQDRRTARAIAAEERRIDRRFRKWVRTLHRRDHRFWVWVRTPKAQRIPMAPKTAEKSDRRNRFSLPAYSRPIIDKLGRQGIFLSFEYDGAKRNDFGVFRRRTEYSFQSDGVRRDAIGRPIYTSNMGRTPEEICEAADALEGIMRAERANAKLSVNAVLQLPHDASVNQQLQIVRRFCSEVCAAHDLPYVAVLHKADKDGDQRNDHAHITFAFRPMVRVGGHKWAVGVDLRTDLDGPDQFFEYRRLAAEIMTNVMRKAGHNRIYTHLSNAERGLTIVPQIKLRKEKASQVRRGEFVADNAFNAREVEAGEQVLTQVPARQLAKIEARPTRMVISPVDLPRGRVPVKILSIRRIGRVMAHRPLALSWSSPPNQPGVKPGELGTSAGPRVLALRAGAKLAKPLMRPSTALAIATMRVPMPRRTAPLVTTALTALPLGNGKPSARGLLGLLKAVSPRDPISINASALGKAPVQLKRLAALLNSKPPILQSGPLSRPSCPVQDQGPSRGILGPQPLSLVAVLAIRRLRLTGAVKTMRGQTEPLLPPLRLSGRMPLGDLSGVHRPLAVSPKTPATADRVFLAPAAVASTIGAIGRANQLRTVQALSGSAMPRIVPLLGPGAVIAAKAPMGIAENPGARLPVKGPANPDLTVVIQRPVRASVVALALGRGSGATIVAGLSFANPFQAIEPGHPPLLPTLQRSNQPRDSRTELPCSIVTRPLSHHSPQFVEQLCPAELQPLQSLHPTKQRQSGDGAEIEQLRQFRKDLADQVATMKRAQGASTQDTRMDEAKENAVAPQLTDDRAQAESSNSAASKDTPESLSPESATAPAPGPNISSLTQQEKIELLRSRTFAFDESFRKKVSMDRTTVAKVLWTYDDMKPEARDRLSPFEKTLYATAASHPKASELRSALKKRQAARREEINSQGKSQECERGRTIRQNAKQAHAQAAFNAQQQMGGGR